MKDLKESLRLNWIKSLKLDALKHSQCSKIGNKFKDIHGEWIESVGWSPACSTEIQVSGFLKSKPKFSFVAADMFQPILNSHQPILTLTLTLKASMGTRIKEKFGKDVVGLTAQIMDFRLFKTLPVEMNLTDVVSVVWQSSVVPLDTLP